MFSFQREDKQLQLLHNQSKIIDGIQFQVQLDQLGEFELDFMEVMTEQSTNQYGNYQRFHHVYKHDEKIDLSFIIDCYDDFIHAYVNVSVSNERPQGHHDYLASEDAIVIQVNGLANLQDLVAHYRHKDWWTRPHFDHDLTTLPKRTQSLLWKDNGDYYQLLPIVNDAFKSEMKGSNQGFNIALSSYDGGRTQAETLAFVLAKDNNPFHLSKKITKRVLELTGKSRTISERRYPEQLDYLGWCSWDAFYQDVNQEGIINKVKELKDKQIPVKWLMIDDGWSQINDQRLSAFEPDKSKFPDGFKTLTDDLRANYGIDSIGVWHTLAGYWGGVDPDSSLAQEMEPHLFKTNSKRLVPYPDKSKGYGFWDAWHSYLEQQGINFVKVDGQSGLNNFLREQVSIGEASNETHKALEASVGIHFDHCIINCMGMALENVYNRPISAVSRSSDDFVPDTEEYGFAEHALQNVYNSFYHGEMYYGDWDMFWTVHRDAKRHALLRAISGGPIYTSDRVNQTDADVLWPLIFNDGRIVRCDQPGKPTADTLMVNPTTEAVPMKVWNTKNGVGVLATFHVNDDKTEVKGQISPADIESIQAEEFIVFDYFNKKVTTMKQDEQQEATLNNEEYGLYLIIPKKHAITPIGLLNKYVSAATYNVLNTTDEKLVVQLREGGQFAFTAEVRPQKVTVNGQEVSISKVDSDKSLYSVDCVDIAQYPILEVQL